MNKDILTGLGAFSRAVKAVCILAVVLFSTAIAWSNPAYFPKGSVSDFEQEWYAKHLSAMKEPVLTVRKNDKDYFAFRLLELPTWGRPVAIRIEKVDGKIIRRAIMLSGEGGYKPGRIKRQKKSELTEVDFDAFVDKLQKSGLWSLPLNDDVQGFDGSRLIIETIKDGKHAVFNRWTPEYEMKERKLSDVVRFSNKLLYENFPQLFKK